MYLFKGSCKNSTNTYKNRENIFSGGETICLTYQLKHILPVTKKTGDIDYRIADHDVKDFYQIIKAHGVDWFQTIKTTISSLYDMEPSEEDGISL